MGTESNNDTDELKQPSVQDIIDRLLQVEDRSQPFDVQIWNIDGAGNVDYSRMELVELVTTDKKPACVELGIYLNENSLADIQHKFFS